MNILCLMPTYGRPALVENAIACYLSQDYPAENRKLLIVDDAGQLAPQTGDGWEVISTADRFPTLIHKYNAMLTYEGALSTGKWHAVALMDDDDIYGPAWLSSHAAALRSAQWSYPDRVWNLHKPPATGWSKPGQEPSSGRFWASAAVKVDVLQAMGGFKVLTDATFDQQHLSLWWHYGGDPGRPESQYVYGWGRSNHVSMKMGHKDWYERQGIMTKRKGVRLTPRMDEQTQAVWRFCGFARK